MRALLESGVVERTGKKGNVFIRVTAANKKFEPEEGTAETDSLFEKGVAILFVAVAIRSTPKAQVKRSHMVKNHMAKAREIAEIIALPAQQELDQDHWDVVSNAFARLGQAYFELEEWEEAIELYKWSIGSRSSRYAYIPAIQRAFALGVGLGKWEEARVAMKDVFQSVDTDEQMEERLEMFETNWMAAARNYPDFIDGVQKLIEAVEEEVVYYNLRNVHL